MGKFLLGLITGVILVVLIGVIGFFAIASLRSKPATIADGSTLVLHLSGEVPEKPPIEFSIPGLGERPSITVENVWSMLRRAATDSRIKAVIFEPEGASLGWGAMQEVRADLENFRKSGKPLVAWLKSPSLRDYYMASAASKIYMPPTDLLNLKGIGFQLMYFKNTLDKLGVQVDVQHAGKFKDYGDQWTRSTMSPETKEVMNSLADDLYGDLLAVIAKGRGKDEAAVRSIIDNGPFLAKQAKANGLIDDLRYEDEVFGEMKTTLHQTELKRASERDYARVTDASAGLGATDNTQIAFVVGEGTITRGDDSDADNFESGAFDHMLERVGNDTSIKAAIIRRYVARHESAEGEETDRDFDGGRSGIGWLLHGDDRKPDCGLSGNHYRLDRRGVWQAESARTLRQAGHHERYGEPWQIRADRFGLFVAYARGSGQTEGRDRCHVSGLPGQSIDVAEEAGKRY